MGKRSNFVRNKNDLYDTPAEAIIPLLPFLPHNATYYEPCYGNGALVHALDNHNIPCIGHSDLELNAATTWYDTQADLFITNPPWSRDILHPIIHNLRVQRPTWLLFDANWMFTKQAKDYLTYCSQIVTVGRIKWIPGTKMTGKDDSCWYLFGQDKTFTTFYGRR